MDSAPTPTDGELQQLHQRIAELETRLHMTNQLVSDVFDAVPYIISVNMVEGQYIMTDINQAGIQATGRPRHEWINKTTEELFPPEQAAVVRQRLTECIQQGVVLEFEEQLSFPTGDIWLQTLYIPIHNDAGNVVRIVTTSFDITARKQRELEELQEREMLIEQQSLSLAELSTPILTISHRAIAVPLIGTIDSRRAQQIMEMLLSGVVTHNASIALIDITGVSLVDTAVAHVLIQATRAVRLIGAETVLTGIRPEIAQTLVGLGIDLTSIVTLATLRDGIAYVLNKHG